MERITRAFAWLNAVVLKQEKWWNKRKTSLTSTFQKVFSFSGGKNFFKVQLELQMCFYFNLVLLRCRSLMFSSEIRLIERVVHHPLKKNKTNSACRVIIGTTVILLQDRKN